MKVRAVLFDYSGTLFRLEEDDSWFEGIEADEGEIDGRNVSYLLADQFHLSGVIATVTAAIVLGNLGPGRAILADAETAIDSVWEFVAYLLTASPDALPGSDR